MHNAVGWRHYLFDTMTGQIGEQIDVPSFQWELSVGDSAFTTTRTHEWGESQYSGVELPWTQIHGKTAYDRAKQLTPYKRGILTCFRTGDEDIAATGTPIIGTALGVRTSTRRDVSMPGVSIMGLLANRYLVHADAFGKGTNHTSKQYFEYNNLSYRALACVIVQQCTMGKPGGSLPIDLPYLNERGTHRLPDFDEEEAAAQEEAKAKYEAEKAAEASRWQAEQNRRKQWDADEKKRTDAEKAAIKKIADKKTRDAREKERAAAANRRKAAETSRRETEQRRHDNALKRIESAQEAREKAIATSTRVRYFDYNVTNHSCADILQAIASSVNGPDLQFRPYLADSQHVRWELLGGSDGDRYLRSKNRVGFASYGDAGASTIENLSVDRAAPIMRVYGVGAGSGTGAQCYLAEDLTLTRTMDPYPLIEQTLSASDTENYTQLQSATKAILEANKRPLMQIKGEINVFDEVNGRLIHPLGSFWPGEQVILHIQDFPDLPDGDYTTRLMHMSGDESGRVQLTFDVMREPL